MFARFNPFFRKVAVPFVMVMILAFTLPQALGSGFFMQTGVLPADLWSAARSRPLPGPGGSEALLHQKIRSTGPCGLGA